MTLNMRESYSGSTKRAMEEIHLPSPSCLKCSHFKMCVIARSIFPMSDQLFGNLKKHEQPFQPEEIAKLCQWYDVRVEEKEQEFPNGNA